MLGGGGPVGGGGMCEHGNSCGGCAGVRAAITSTSMYVCTFADVIPIHCRVGGFVNPTIWTDKLRATTHIRRGEPTRGIVLARWGGLGKSNGFSYIMHLFYHVGLERWSHGQHGW
jgi:hypothetical protein